VIVADVLYGWEPRTRYVQAESATRGQAKALVAWEDGEPFTALRCRRVWLHEREITEDDALFINMDDWYEGYVGWIECSPKDEGAIAWWEVTWPR
jgi:hypothetical protein